MNVFRFFQHEETNLLANIEAKKVCSHMEG